MNKARRVDPFVNWQKKLVAKGHFLNGLKRALTSYN